MRYTLLKFPYADDHWTLRPDSPGLVGTAIKAATTEDAMNEANKIIGKTVTWERVPSPDESARYRSRLVHRDNNIDGWMSHPYMDDYNIFTATDPALAETGHAGHHVDCDGWMSHTITAVRTVHGTWTVFCSQGCDLHLIGSSSSPESAVSSYKDHNSFAPCDGRCNHWD